MEHVLGDFIMALRNAGVRVSIAESIDAAHALDLMGYGDKEIFKISLAAVLAKTPEEKEIFSTCFDRFFSFNDFSELIREQNLDSDSEDQQTMSPLSMMLLSGDQSGIMTAMMQAGRTAEISNMQYFTQKNPYIRRILNDMGMQEVNRDIQQLALGDDPFSQQQAQALGNARGALIDYVRDFVERHYELFTRTTRNFIIEDHLKNIKLSNIEERDFQQLHTVVKRMVKRLNDSHSRRKKSFRRGQLDFKKTLRKNISYQGPLFDVMWKKRKIDRPNVIVICDVSRSVRMIVRFFLLFLYSLNETIVKIRSFIFCNNLIEVSHIFEDHPVEEAVEILQTGKGLDIGLSRTNYGEAFREFQENWLSKVTKKTTVIILGDGRNNYYEPETGILRLMQEKSKRLIWLNPEIPSYWNAGDSEMQRYGPLCDIVKECNTLSHLERIVDDIL